MIKTWIFHWLWLQTSSRGQLKCDGTRTGNRFRLPAKRMSPFKSAGGRQFSRLLAAKVCASALVMLDTPCSEVVWRVLAAHSNRQFPLHFPSRASPCAIAFQLERTFSDQWNRRCVTLRSVPVLTHTVLFSVIATSVRGTSGLWTKLHQ